MVFRDQPAHTMRPAFRTVGDLRGSAGSFASYVELDEDRRRLTADLAEALRLLDLLTPVSFISDYEGPGRDAHALLVRHGIREGEGEPTACPDSTLLAWGLHEVDPDGQWEA